MGSKESKAFAEASISLESEIERLSDQIQDIKENFDEIRKNLFPQKEILTTLTKIQEESSVLNQGLVKLLDSTEEQQVRVINLESQQIQLGALQEDQVKHLDEIKRNFNSRIAFYDKKIRDMKSACHYLENECFEPGSPEKSFISDADGKISTRSKIINKNFNKRMNENIGSGMKQSGSIRGKLHKARLERWFTLKYEKRSLKFEKETNEIEDCLGTVLSTRGNEDFKEESLHDQDVFDMSGEELETENVVGVAAGEIGWR